MGKVRYELWVECETRDCGHRKLLDADHDASRPSIAKKRERDFRCTVCGHRNARVMLRIGEAPGFATHY